MDRDETRMKLWYEIYAAAFARWGNTSHATDVANSSVKAFDREFPDPEPTTSADHGTPEERG